MPAFCKCLQRFAKPRCLYSSHSGDPCTYNPKQVWIHVQDFKGSCLSDLPCLSCPLPSHYLRSRPWSLEQVGWRSEIEISKVAPRLPGGSTGGSTFPYPRYLMNGNRDTKSCRGEENVPCLGKNPSFCHISFGVQPHRNRPL